MMMAASEVIGIRQQIADRLRGDIISGALAPNQKVTEESLAQRFGVSRGPIRDVLLELSKEGLLITRANRDTRVNDIPPPELQALMVRLRLDIEAYAIRRVAKQASPELIERLEAAVAELSRRLREGDFTEVTKADIAFHRTIVFEAGGEDLANLWQPVIMRMRMNYQRITTPDQSIGEHEAILEAIRSGNAKRAEEALRDNIR
ncbi:GntR family transcriptional regulator [Sphingopyxis jiangsuensis]|uniref:GntR family transcriptional regulator n=1 Tax=Sphingopyxis jiangsuensis TaxID=2871171 RepID=UPI002ED36446